MSAPLTLLRSAITSSATPITLTATDIVLPSLGMSLPRSTPTALHAKRGKGAAYTLDAIYHQYLHADLGFQAYVAACQAAGAAHVQVIDKRDVLAYVRGEVDDCAGLVGGPQAASVNVDKAPRARAKVEPQAEVEAVGARRDIGDDRAVSRNMRCLDAVMLVGNCDFSALKDKLAAEVKRRKEGKETGDAKKVAESGVARAEKKKAPDPRGDRYTAPVDRFYRENMGSDFYDIGIDPSMSFKKGGKRPREEEIKGSASAVKPEKEVETNETKRADRVVGRSSSAGGSSVKRSRFSAPALRPIIIVPGASSLSSLLTLFNVTEFLENGKFITVKELKASGGGLQGMQSKITVRRQPAGSVPDGVATYEVVSNPKKLQSDEWRRVVACVCTGHAWQFKDFEGYNAGNADKGIPGILQAMCGFVFHYDDDEKPKAAEAWPVTFIGLKRSVRNNDVMERMKFWDKIDMFCGLRRVHVRY